MIKHTNMTKNKYIINTSNNKKLNKILQIPKKYLSTLALIFVAIVITNALTL